jgi:hypothetical protein
LACLVLLALLAGGLVLVATRQGPPLGADDAVYAGTARSVAAGNGLDVPIHYYPLGNVDIGTPPPGSSAPRPTPLVIYAPLEPILLAAGGQHPIGTARIEDPIFFALAVLLVGLFVLAITDELWLAAAAQLVIGFSLSTGTISAPGTEAAALFFAVVALVAVLRYRDRPRWPWLVLGSLSMALATLTRYAAAGLIVWGVIVLRKKIGAALGLLVIGAGPVGAWFVYERVSGRTTGHAVGFHVVIATVRSGLDSIAYWILPSENSIVVAALGTLAVTVIVIVALWRRAGPAPPLLVLFAVVQIVVLEVAVTFFDAEVDLDPRELIPVYLAVVVALACAVPRTRSMMVVTVVVVAACALRFGIDTTTHPSGGYTTPQWQHSAIVAEVRALPEHAIIYSDAPDLIYLLDGRATSSIPETEDFSTLKSNPRFDEQINEIRRTLSTRGGYVVYIRGLGREGFVPSEADLKSRLSLRLVHNAVDGAVYTIR